MIQLEYETPPPPHQRRMEAATGDFSLGLGTGFAVATAIVLFSKVNPP